MEEHVNVRYEYTTRSVATEHTVVSHVSDREMELREGANVVVMTPTGLVGRTINTRLRAV